MYHLLSYRYSTSCCQAVNWILDGFSKRDRKSGGKLLGENGWWQSGKRLWALAVQGESNPCLRRERRADHLMMSTGCMISGAIQVKNYTKKHRF